jgi:hypothetical protein
MGAAILPPVATVILRHIGVVRRQAQTASWRFEAKACPALDAGWVPVRVKKTRQNMMLESRF